MKIDILTLFPKMFDGFLSESIISRAIKNKNVEINIINFRDYSKLPNKMVDDTIYGGGPGMLLRCEPIFECIDDINKDKDATIILLTPSGIPYKQSIAKKLTLKKHLIFICGHYEGFDERIKTLADIELSIGDFVLTGGEIPSMAIIDSIVRLLPGVINKDSLDSESFNNNLLDYPSYTKPASYRGMDVPSVLISGNHKKIEEWRLNKQIEETKLKRPDLLKK
jgi:tRNA (guanine37-N1)-methyltransferase